MSLDNAKRVVAWARAQEGASYLWGGKGDMMFDPVHGLIVSPYPGTFDCSGLATCAYLAACPEFAEDMRAIWNSQIMLKTLKEAVPLAALNSSTLDFEPCFVGALVIYPAHVAICTGRIFRSGLLEVIEAAGGDQRTTQPTPGACVRIGAESHSPRARLGLRYLTGCEP